MQLALEQYNQHGGTLVGNGNQFDLLTSDVTSDERRLQVVDTPYRQAMQSSNPDPNVLQRLGGQVLHFVSQNNDDQQHRADRRRHAGILVTVLLSTALLISSIVCVACSNMDFDNIQDINKVQGAMCIRVMLVLHSSELQR